MNKEIDFQIDFILQDIIEFHRELAVDGEIIMSDASTLPSAISTAKEIDLKIYLFIHLYANSLYA